MQQNAASGYDSPHVNSFQSHFGGASSFPPATPGSDPQQQSGPVGGGADGNVGAASVQGMGGQGEGTSGETPPPALVGNSNCGTSGGSVSSSIPSAPH